MNRSKTLFPSLAVPLSLSLLACAPDPSDVRPTLEKVSLSVQGERLVGTVAVHYEASGEVAMTVTDPELQLEDQSRSVRAIELVFPADFDAELQPGEARTATFAIDDDGVWSSWCGVALTAQENHHSREEGGKVISSLGAEAAVEIACE